MFRISGKSPKDPIKTDQGLIKEKLRVQSVGEIVAYAHRVGLAAGSAGPLPALPSVSTAGGTGGGGREAAGSGEVPGGSG